MMLLAEAYLHSLDPYAVQFSESFGLRWYGLAYAFGFLLAWLFFRWMSKTERSPLTVQQVGDMMMYGIAGVIIGGRLGHVIFYGHGRPFIEFTDAFPYWEVLAINRGGMSAHGGVLGVLIATIIYARRHKLSSLHLLDMGSMIGAVGLGVGRLANFVNAELWGKRLPEPMQAAPPWWAVQYPQEIRDFSTDQLAQLAGFAPEVGVTSSEWTSWLTGLTNPEILQLLNNKLEQMIVAVQSGNDTVASALRPMLTAYYPSQVFQAITDGVILGGFLAIVWIKPRKPGVIGGCFLGGYGLLRICSEVFRQPDEGVALLLGLSRGQVLSILMVLVPVVGLRIVMKRDVPKLGGWIRRSRTD